MVEKHAFFSSVAGSEACTLSQYLLYQTDTSGSAALSYFTGRSTLSTVLVKLALLLFFLICSSLLLFPYKGIT